MKIENKNLGMRIVQWAKEYGKHFCLHDIAPYFSTATDKSISGMLGYEVRLGRLHKSYDKNSCKALDKRHHTFVYNQEQKPEPSNQSKAIKKAWKKRKNEGAIHLIKAGDIATCPYCKKKVLIVRG
jgi:hypothetical protein